MNEDINVIKFPKENKRTKFIQQKKPKATKQSYIDYLVEFYARELLAKFSTHGFAVDKEEFTHDFSLTIDHIRSCLYRNVGIKHKLHSTIDSLPDKDDNS